MSITEEKINRNYLLWIDYLKKYNCYSEDLINDYGESIKLASFAMNETSGGAYQGSLLDVVLSSLCVIASHINENAFGINDKGKIKHPFLQADKNSLMKVLLLQHISKALFPSLVTLSGITIDCNLSHELNVKSGILFIEQGSLISDNFLQ